MDVYHQILLSLYEACGGNEQKVVNLVDLIKREGFGGSLDNICTFMSDQGWIAEASAQGVYRITHWGVEEARRSAAAGQPQEQEGLRSAIRDARKAAEVGRELADLFDQYADLLASPDEHAQADKTHQLALRKLEELKKVVHREAAPE